ncbi:unnamed protein product, partial [Ranitomeya imitator]
FHPQSNGQTERVNQNLETYLRCFISENQEDWVKYLPLAEFAINNRTHESTGSSKEPPFALMTALHTLGILLMSFKRISLFIISKSGRFGAENQEDWVKYLPLAEFAINNRTHESTGFMAIVNSVAFRLALPQSFKIHNVFHRSLLKKVVASSNPSPSPPSPVLADGNLEFRISRVMDSRLVRQSLQYLVHWRGYGPEKRTKHLTEEKCLRMDKKYKSGALKHKEKEQKKKLFSSCTPLTSYFFVSQPAASSEKIDDVMDQNQPSSSLALANRENTASGAHSDYPTNTQFFTTDPWEGHQDHDSRSSDDEGSETCDPFRSVGSPTSPTSHTQELDTSPDPSMTTTGSDSIFKLNIEEPYPTEPFLFQNQTLTTNIIRVLLEHGQCQPGLNDNCDNFPNDSEKRRFSPSWYSRKGLAFRGHREYAGLGDQDVNEGNFLELLKLLAQYDTVLENHLKNPVGRVTYLSLESQNELISALASETMCTIVQDVKAAQFFSVIVDSAIDIKRSNQFSLSLRYVTNSRNSIDRFIKFEELPDGHAESFYDVLINTLTRELGLNVNLMRGQAYDGARTMSDVFWSQFEHRFSDFREIAKLFSPLSNKHFQDPDVADRVIELARFYSDDVSTEPKEVFGEFLTFRNMYSELSIEKKVDTTDKILPFLIANDMHHAFPNLSTLYGIYLTIPVSSAKAERSFSRLKLIKTHLRASMNEARLSNLTLLSIERDIELDKDKVVGRFAHLRERRMALASPNTNPARKTRRSRRHRSRPSQNDDQIAGMETTNIVYNISSYCLSPSEMNLLQRGLTFCPVSRFNPFLLDQELHQFFRTLRLKAHFLGPQSTPPTESSSQNSFTLKDLNLCIPSSFQPSRMYHPVETFIEFVKKDIKAVLESIENGNLRIKHNLSIEKFRSLQLLKARKDLIIKPADKGGAIVVLDSNPSFDIAREIKYLTSHYLQLGIIDQKLVEFLNCQHPVIPVFYTLPKVHKDLARPPGRPIVASTNSLLSPLAITMDKILSPLVPLRVPSHSGILITTTARFVTFQRYIHLGVLPKGCTLVTMDVNSLYTSIEHQMGLEAFFFQIKGTAMGSNVAPPYANIFMDYFETSFMYPHLLFSAHIVYWKRFIDDIFFVWTGNSEDLSSSIVTLIHLSRFLSFTIHSDQHSVNFLDTTITITPDGMLESDLYVKTTDRNSLLLYTSSHPSHIKKALPKSQHDRINRIVSDPETRARCHWEMDNKFRNRGYPNKILDSTNFEAQSGFRRPKLQRLAFVNTFHPFNFQISRCILKHWNVLQRAYPQVPEFLNKPIMCYKRTQNLRNHWYGLIELKQQFLSTPRNGTFPCLSCLQCSNITKGDFFTHPRSGRKFPIQGHYTCDSTYVVYLIKCPCGLGYVGETTQHIRDRISQHKSTICCGRTLLPIPAHSLFIRINTF